MNEAVLVTKAKGWTKVERAAYGGMPVRLLQSRDWKGNELVLLLDGPLLGEMRWVKPEEIQRTNAGDTCVGGGR